jgi:hypothetical protein
MLMLAAAAAAELVVSELINVGFGLWTVSYWVRRLDLQ